MTPQRTLPADVYDALELSALAYGGIGAFNREINNKPHCLAGHLAFVGAMKDGDWPEMVGVPISVCTNDEAVCNTIGHYPAEMGKRISFKRWCKELNVVRGE